MIRVLTMGMVVAGLVALTLTGGCNQGQSGGKSSSGFGSGWGGGAMGLMEGDNDRAEGYGELLKHGTDAEKIMAAQKLGEFGDSYQAIELLEKGTKDANPDVRAASADSLRRIGSDRALHHLQEAERKGRVPAGYTEGTTPPAKQSGKM